MLIEIAWSGPGALSEGTEHIVFQSPDFFLRKRSFQSRQIMVRDGQLLQIDSNLSIMSFTQ